MLSVRIQITVLIPHNKQAQTRLPLGKHFLIFLAEKEPPSFPVLLTHFYATLCSVTQHHTMYFNYSYSHLSFPGDYKHFEEKDSIPSI